MKQWVSDRGSHFRNQLVREIRERMHCAHHFTLASCPWTNGSVEVVRRELLRAMKALLSEFKMPFKMWPTVVPIVQSISNNTPLARINGLFPRTAYTQLPADSPLLTIEAKINGSLQRRLISRSCVQDRYRSWTKCRKHWMECIGLSSKKRTRHLRSA